MKRSTLFLAGLFLFGCVIFLGCAQPSQSQQDAAAPVEPVLMADCIAQYHKANGSAYMTRQQHSFNPGEGYFQMTAQEPTGKQQYTLVREQFTESSPKTAVLSDMPESFCTPMLAAALYYSFCAGGGLLDTASLVSEENVKLEGQWYQPLKTTWPNGSITITLLRSLDSNRTELIHIEDSAKGLVWLLKNYNPRYSKELEKNIPRKIDVFDIRDGVASKELMIQFEYIDIRVATGGGDEDVPVEKTNLTAD
ncbi:MAG: hypothetical protein L0Y36_04990 [Planctomycetales bacterium]|nr:hypothetical protein [Planctomycetales bacterium]